jgi:hypothetical protein
MRKGRIVDPRLSLTCRDPVGRSIGFGWVVPLRGATRVVVGTGRTAERYAVRGRLPLRIATRDVELDSARVEVVQYAANGDELERRRVVMHAAG